MVIQVLIHCSVSIAVHLQIRLNTSARALNEGTISDSETKSHRIKKVWLVEA